MLTSSMRSGPSWNLLLCEVDGVGKTVGGAPDVGVPVAGGATGVGGAAGEVRIGARLEVGPDALRVAGASPDGTKVEQY